MSTYDSLGDGEMVLTELPAETERAASIVVAGYATDADDCRELLAMLGLPVMLPPRPPKPGELISAEPARAHIHRHRGAGRTLGEIAAAAEVSLGTIRLLIYGRDGTLPIHITQDVSAAILAVSFEPGEQPLAATAARRPKAVCGKCGEPFTPRPITSGRCQPCKAGLVHARRAREHLEKMEKLGATWARLGAASGIGPRTLAAIASGRQKHLSAANEQAILAIVPTGTAVPTQ